MSRSNQNDLKHFFGAEVSSFVTEFSGESGGISLIAPDANHHIRVYAAQYSMNSSVGSTLAIELKDTVSGAPKHLVYGGAGDERRISWNGRYIKFDDLVVLNFGEDESVAISLYYRQERNRD